MVQSQTDLPRPAQNRQVPALEKSDAGRPDPQQHLRHEHLQNKTTGFQVLLPHHLQIAVHLELLGVDPVPFARSGGQEAVQWWA